MIRVAFVIALVAAAQAQAAEVYISEGRDGETSFSDEPSPGATKVDVVTPGPTDPHAKSATDVDTMLRVADELEQSRLQRESDRAEARAARAAAEREAAALEAAQQPVYEERYSYPYVPGYPQHPNRPPHRPDRPHPPGSPVHPIEPEPVPTRPGKPLRRTD